MYVDNVRQCTRNFLKQTATRRRIHDSYELRTYLNLSSCVNPQNPDIDANPFILYPLIQAARAVVKAKGDIGGETKANHNTLMSWSALNQHIHGEQEDRLNLPQA